MGIKGMDARFLTKRKQMDPNACLEEIRSLTESVLNTHDRDEQEYHSDCQRLAELIQSLDEWISKGGYFPGYWENKS